MQKTIVLLANSIKLGGRCIAGVEVQRQDGPSEWTVVKETASRPKWIRPVSNVDDGEVPLEMAVRFSNLDIVKLTKATRSPSGYQSENYLFGDIEKIDALPSTARNLSSIVQDPGDQLFGNRGKAVPDEKIHLIDHSLIFVKPEQFSSYSTRSSSGSAQKRGIFTLNEVEYDLPITDPGFVLGSEKEKKTFLTLSLGVLHNGWHSKLIAGVFCV